MSELIQKNDDRATIRWKLLTGASALALAAYISSARAEDAARPQFWIELGGQLSRLDNGQESFTPIFPNSPPRPSIFSPSQKFEKPPLYGFEEFGALSFQPSDSQWLFSASIRYGRSGRNRQVQQETNPDSLKYFPSVPDLGVPVAQRFAQTKARTSERYDVIDFEAGRDVGLGMFGNKEASSVISAGVRFAQFRGKTNISLKSDPDWHFNYFYLPTLGFSISYGQAFHDNLASLKAQRSFHGIGPSISWKASEPLAGNVQDGGLTLDWSVNAAVLFGRQKTRTQHQSTGRYFSHNGLIIFVNTIAPQTTAQYVGVSRTRSRNVTVPNVGGSVGLSWRLQNFKVSMGYKADFFFNAIDGGIDARKSENRAFYGPYASISIGLGD